MYIPPVYRPNCGDDPYTTAEPMVIDPPSTHPWVKVKRAPQVYDKQGVRTSEGVKEQHSRAPDYRSLYATYKPDNAEGNTVAEQYVCAHLLLNPRL